ncbi:MAG: ABC transporter permease [Thermoanaerobaculia bacterium]
MNAARAAAALAWSYLLETARSRTALFFTLAFPQLFLFVFAFVFAGGRSRDVGFLMPGLLTLTTITSSFFGYSMRLVAERERGAFRRLRVTPTAAGTIVGGHFLHAVLLLGLALAFQFGLGWAVFRFPVAGSAVALIAVLVAGALAFVALGLFVGCVGRDTRSAPALTNLLVFPMMFLSGSAMPFHALAPWIQQIGRFLPATYLNEGLQRAMIQGRPLAGVAGPIAVLLLFALVGLVLNALLFRWESTDALPPKRLFAGLALLGVLIVAVALAGPELSMSIPPPR